MPSLPLVETAAPEKPQPKPVLPVDHRDEFRLVTKESGVPFLENVPYINRLFKNVGVYRAREMNNSELNNGHPLQTPYEMRRQKQLQSPSNVYRLIKNVGAHQPRQIDNYELLWWDVSKVLGELRKQELGSQTAEERLMSMLPCHYPGENGESSTPNGKSATYVFGNDGNGKRVKFGNDEPTIKIVGDDLFALGSPKYITEVDRRVSVFKKYGCHQIKVDIQLMTVTPADFQNLNVKWAMVNSNAANVQQAGTLPIVESLPVLASGITSVKLPDRPVSAVSYIQKSPVAQYALIEPAEVANMVATVKQADEFRLLSAPSVIVLNGQDASVTQGTMRPFVVGVEYIEVENKSDFVIQPVVQSQLDGIKISMCPILQSQENESVVFELTTILKMSHVLGVEVEELPPVNGKTVKIQIPEIETVEINSSLKIPLNKTLVLSSSFRNKDGVKEKLLACIKCKLVDPSEIVEPPQPTAEPVQMK